MLICQNLANICADTQKVDKMSCSNNGEATTEAREEAVCRVMAAGGWLNVMGEGAATVKLRMTRQPTRQVRRDTTCE